MYYTSSREFLYPYRCLEMYYPQRCIIFLEIYYTPKDILKPQNVLQPQRCIILLEMYYTLRDVLYPQRCIIPLEKYFTPRDILNPARDVLYSQRYIIPLEIPLEMFYTLRDILYPQRCNIPLLEILISSLVFYILSYLQLLAATTLPNPTNVFLNLITPSFNIFYLSIHLFIYRSICLTSLAVYNQFLTRSELLVKLLLCLTRRGPRAPV